MIGYTNMKKILLSLLPVLFFVSSAFAVSGSSVQPIVTPEWVLFGSQFKTITSTSAVWIDSTTGILYVNTINIKNCVGAGCGSGGGGGSSIYPATGTPSFPFGMSVSSMTVSTITVSGEIILKDGSILTSTSPFLNLGSLSATTPVLYNSSTGKISLDKVSLSTMTVGSLPAASIASGALGASVLASSITLAAMYGAPTLVGTNFTGLPGAQVGSGVPAANIAAGALPSTVIASSIAAGVVYPGAITGTINNSNLDSSSVTKQGFIPFASITSTGLLTASDWNTFNNKGSGGLSAVFGGTGLTGGGNSGVLFINAAASTTYNSVAETITQAWTFTSSSTTVTGSLVVKGGVLLPITSVSATYTAVSTDTVVLADASGGSFSVTLSTISIPTGKVYRIKRQNSGSNTVTVQGASGNIDGAATQVLSTQYAAIDVLWDGTNWEIL